MNNVIGIFIVFILGFCVYLVLKKSNYDKSNYKKESGNNYFGVRMDKGKYGEYLSFNMLEKIKGDHRILTNVYLPKGNGETTEIDLIYIHETGIYVLESKNYSGWIFGDEKSKYWMQTLQNGQKEKFYSPIFQNNTHIKYLIKLLQIYEKIIKSIIVFSERCTIKKMEVTSENVKVINRYELNRTIEKLINNSPKIPVPNQLTWEVFEAAVEVVINNGGKALKGSARSKGARLGDEKLPMNSVEGYVAHKVHGVKEGESSFGPGFVICAILDWADICNNERGFLTIKPSSLMEVEESKKEN